MTTATANGTAKAAKATADTRNLYRRLIDAGNDVGIIPKVKKQGMPFPSVDHDTVTRRVRPVLFGHGVCTFSSVVACNQDGNRTELTVRTTFVNADAPDQRIEVDTVGYGCGNDDKGPGKAMSYAVKYALLKTLGLETGEDAELEDGRHRRGAGPGKAPGLTRDPSSPKLDLRAVVMSYSGKPWPTTGSEAWEAFKHAHDMPPSGQPDPDTAARIAAYLAHRHAQGHTWADVLASPDKGFGSN